MKRIYLAGLIAIPLFFSAQLTPISTAAGSTAPFFAIDANNPSSFTYTGSSVGSSITESANGATGTASGVSYEASALTNSLVFGTGKYLTFSNNVKPDFTNGASIQIVAYFTSSSYDSSWPRVLAVGSTSAWGAAYDEFSIELSQSGQLQIFMNKAGGSNTYTCWSTGNEIVANAFALYSFQVGTGVCNISVNGTAVSTTTSEATVTYASKIPVTSNTWNFRVASMTHAVQSTLPNGKIRSIIMSTGTSSTNSVTFMENGGSGYMASQIGSTIANLNTNTYTKSGYYLTGWNTKSDGSGNSYAPGGSFNFGTTSSMLFAQWAQLIPSLSLSGITTASFRSSTPITLTTNVSGKYTFFESGKRIPGCISLNGAPPSVTCNWRPAKIGAYLVTAVGKVNGTNYSSNASTVIITKRSGIR